MKFLTMVKKKEMSKYVVYRGINISYTDDGRGSNIVLLHGYLEAKSIWQPLSSILTRRNRVIAIDLPGHGSSGVAGDTHTMEFMAGAVKAIVDFLGLSGIFMIGHSLGGYVTLAFLEKYPQYLSGYCLFHSHPHPDTQAAKENRFREMEIVRAGKKNVIYPGNITRMYAEENLVKMPKAVTRSEAIASRTSAEGIISALNGMVIRPSRKTLLEKGTKPLLWILGRNDLYFSPEIVTSTVKMPSNAKLVILEHSGHLGFVEETELSGKLIGDFVSELTDSKN